MDLLERLNEMVRLRDMARLRDTARELPVSMYWIGCAPCPNQSYYALQSSHLERRQEIQHM